MRSEELEPVAGVESEWSVAHLRIDTRLPAILLP